MSLDPEALDTAIRADGGPRVRELLRDATEAERRSCAKALRDFLAGPGFPALEPVRLGSTALRAA